MIYDHNPCSHYCTIKQSMECLRDGGSPGRPSTGPGPHCNHSPTHRWAAWVSSPEAPVLFFHPGAPQAVGLFPALLRPCMSWAHTLLHNPHHGWVKFSFEKQVSHYIVFLHGGDVTLYMKQGPFWGHSQFNYTVLYRVAEGWIGQLPFQVGVDNI